MLLAMNITLMGLVVTKTQLNTRTMTGTTLLRREGLYMFENRMSDKNADSRTLSLADFFKLSLAHLEEACGCGVEYKQ